MVIAVAEQGFPNKAVILRMTMDESIKRWTANQKTALPRCV